ncbi:hypothetical protein VB711_17385 [Cronbergia sp. UHCC 0137]|uniref:beta strand repeat-containing protein n=1 Tax=Cronbergia sp. UHCC 0137 TaxID=3110239 RepID=UPI002B21D9FF|nr:hypothetical protein [Cronbergia sp. UHCC 0137]MEA5619600.1 hypothetical protein [Cronbergia sp. UHCC 0137]
MSHNKKSSTRQQARIFRSLVATAFLANGFFQMVAPALAIGTSAGEVISNTATATYEDANTPGTTINAQSNTVTVTVAEVAGITVTAVGTPTFKTDGGTAGTIEAGDVLYFNYKVTNIGNDPTKFRIPDKVIVVGEAQVEPGQNVQVSIDNGANWTSITTADLETGSYEPGESILVRVPIRVLSSAQSNDEIAVTLGNVPGDAQNVNRNTAAGGSQDGDVYTVDNADGTGGNEVDGAPVNGTREASATIKAKVDAVVKPYALATVLKTRSYSDGGTSSLITDDNFTYNLSLRVESSDPTGNSITPGTLTGENITLDGVANTPRILISDAIPLGTQLSVLPTAPTGWTVVYDDSAGSTDGIKANAISWKTVAGSGSPTLSDVKRVGFIYTAGATATTSGDIIPGTTVSGFQVRVAVTGAAPLTVANIAQVFGKTKENNLQVYDDSGDQRPSNYNDAGAPIGTDGNGDGVPDTIAAGDIDDGYASATDITNGELTANTDSGNDNTGTDGGTSTNRGEYNVLTINVAGNDSVINGPFNAPEAFGPTDQNDDFTNKSSPVIATDAAPGSTFNPPSVGFTNTAKNNGGNTNPISLVPTPPTVATDLPNETVVTITYGQDSRKYVWDQANNRFLFVTTVTTVAAGTVINAAAQYITIPAVAPGASVSYEVLVDLPAGTALSTDTQKGYPVPITAFIDDATGGFDVNGTEPRNITIDRVYTGFLRLRKESRILQGDGEPVVGNQGTFSTDPKTPSPGNIIEYRIRYTNISEVQSGTAQNVILEAKNVVITEDGTLEGTLGNNWALDNNTDGQIDTTNVRFTALDSANGTVEFYAGNPANTSVNDREGLTVDTDVTKYIVRAISNVLPGQERTFTFQRKVNNTSQP